jgi:hypothetical protein
MVDLELLCLPHRDVKWFSFYGKHYDGFLKKVKIELPYDQAIPLLGIYLQILRSVFHRDICVMMLIEELFITVSK